MMRRIPVPMVRMSSYAATLVCLAISLAMVACGGSRNSNETSTSQGEEVDIDKLLGVEDKSSKQASSDEDEVLRLLGIVPESENKQTAKPETAKPETTAAAESKTEPREVAQQTGGEVDRLQSELSDKSNRISALQADVLEKDRRILALQAELEKAQRTTQKTSSNGKQREIGNDYAQRYANGRGLYERRQYRDAIKAFSNLLAEDDRNILADNAQYWIGESYYGLGNYAQSIVEFEKVFTFTTSDKSDDALLKLGLCYLKMGDRKQARSEFEQLLANYPKSEYAGQARNYLTKL